MTNISQQHNKKELVLILKHVFYYYQAYNYIESNLLGKTTQTTENNQYFSVCLRILTCWRVVEFLKHIVEFILVGLPRC